MKKFVFTALVLACTFAYADNNGNNGPQNTTSTSNAAAGAIAGSLATGGTSSSRSTATGGKSAADANASTGPSTSTSTSGSSNAVVGSSTSGSSSVLSTISIGENSPERIAADKEIAAANNQTAREVANNKIHNTPSMVGPDLVSSNDTCMGSTSGSLATPGFGLSIGTTWTDTNCVMLKNSRELWNMGFKAAAVAILCNDEKIKTALEITGYVCPVKP